MMCREERIRTRLPNSNSYLITLKKIKNTGTATGSAEAVTGGVP